MTKLLRYSMLPSGGGGCDGPPSACRWLGQSGVDWRGPGGGRKRDRHTFPSLHLILCIHLLYSGQLSSILYIQMIYYILNASNHL